MRFNFTAVLKLSKLAYNMAQVPQTDPNNPNDLPTLDPIGAEETEDGNVEPELEIATGSESDSALGDEV